MAGTLRSIAAGLDAGKAKYLDGVRAATQVSTMISLLRRGKTKRNQALLAEKGELGVWQRHHESEALSNRPLAIEDAAFVEFPYPSVNRHQLSDLVENRVQSVILITIGTLDASLVHPREVFKPAILEGSSSIILSHNHPSGDSTPSGEDHKVTERLVVIKLPSELHRLRPYQV